LAWW